MAGLEGTVCVHVMSHFVLMSAFGFILPTDAEENSNDNSVFQVKVWS